ncbi:MAG: hypothetical protein OQL06_08045 [Gammaproteobacteria bacterium]|nr:hypothetical protein [Gammaproteobacteria bacterium]
MKYSDVLIHLNDKTNTEAKDNLMNKLSHVDGVITPKFNTDKEHMLFVAYDAEITNALTLLNKVKAEGFEAQLVGL